MLSGRRIIGEKAPLDAPLIAVINHENAFLDLMHEIITQQGYEAVCWHADDDTFTRLQEAQPALAIIDINLHDRDAAWALLERIHNDPTTMHIPVIVCTADVSHVRQKAPVLLQYNYVVVEKPFDVEDMLEQVRDTLSRATTTLAS